MKVPVTIITGFLGAGKTTLIRHLLETAEGARIALIINEFGDLGVDLELINGCGIKSCHDENFVELANGCICCTVADDFIPTMSRLLDQDQPADHIVIETSGLALPKPLIKAFNWPEVKARATVDSVIAVVDSSAVYGGQFVAKPKIYEKNAKLDQELDHESPLEEVFEDQVLCADMILLNKSDLLEDKELLQVQKSLEVLRRPATKVLRSSFGRVSKTVLLGLKAAAEDDLAPRRSHHDGEEDHDHNDFESFVFELEGVTDPKIIEERVEEVVLKHDILRVKGFVDVLGKEMRSVIQGVGSRINSYYDRPWRLNEERKTSIVIIGERGIDRVAICNTLRAI